MIKLRFNFGFSLIELIIVITIAALLAGLGFSGYMDSVRVQRRQDAVLSLQKVYLFLSSVDTINGSSVGPCSSAAACTVGTKTCNVITSASNSSSLSFPCVSNNGFYCINHCTPSLVSPITGFSPSLIPAADKEYLIQDEALILQATPVAEKGQNKDQPVSCQNIYLSNQNNIYPSSCVK